jgi:putative flippase GtrA
MKASKNTATVLLRLEEFLRQERETFDQLKQHDARWFTLRLRMAYVATALLPTIAVFCMYIVFHHDQFPPTVVSSAAIALLADVLGFMAAAWKIVLNPGSTVKLEPITRPDN